MGADASGRGGGGDSAGVRRWGDHAAGLLALDRNTGTTVAAIITMTLGEQLWRRFIPKYLERLGAPVLVIGVYGSLDDLLDGIYQYPGGWLADHLGRRKALRLFVAAAAVGYGVIALAPTWPWVFLGFAFALAWSSMASPALFAVVGDALPSARRTLGFSVQSLFRRLPIALAPTLGGLLIAALGIRSGVRLGIAVNLLLAMGTLVLLQQLRLSHPSSPGRADIRAVWSTFPQPLRRLLLSDVFIRTCEGMVDVFVILYALNVVGISAPQFGVLIAIEMTTAILSYLPATQFAHRFGRKPFVILTFLMFAGFPLAVVLARTFGGLAFAAVIGGLREVGEPSRKALILDLAEPTVRARSVGLYYLVRGLTITPAAMCGALLWNVSPVIPFVVAGVIGFIGAVVFTFTVEERYAG